VFSNIVKGGSVMLETVHPFSFFLMYGVPLMFIVIAIVWFFAVGEKG